MLRIGPFYDGPATVIPEKSGIQRILGLGKPSFGQAIWIPACAGKTITEDFGCPNAIARIKI